MLFRSEREGGAQGDPVSVEAVVDGGRTQTETETDGKTDSQAARGTDRQTETYSPASQMDRQTETYRHTCRQTDRHLGVAGELEQCPTAFKITTRETQTNRNRELGCALPRSL